MFTVIGFMLVGILVGFLCRASRLSWIQRAISLLIWILLFLLGVEAGANKQLMDGLYTLGAEAFALALAGTLGSVVAAWGLWHLLYKKGKKEEK